jgi:signal transduction histidine kinase
LYPVLKLFNEKQKKSPFTESQDIELYQISSLLMAENYIELKQYDSCLKYIQLTEVFNSKYPLKYTTIFCNNIRARMLHRMNQDTEAAKIWEKTFNSSLINELDINYKSIISKSLMSVYDTLKNSSKANYYARTYYQIRDSMDNVLYNDRLIVLNNIILENENAQIINQKDNLLKQKQIDIIQVKQQRNLLWLSIVFILMILIFAIILIKLTTNKNNKINKYLKEVENLNRHNEFLISVLAHDLKGPLSSVISNLKDANENQDAEQKNRLIQLSRLASEDIYLLLEQLIHWIRLEKLSEKIKIEEVDLQELIGQQLQAFFNLGILNKKGFNVIYNTRFIKTNKYPLAIVVRNLILNAIKHCTNKKSICLSINYKDGMLEVEIENDFNNLNENFFSSFNSVSNFDNNLTENNSHKFGLVIIKKICKDMGWLIRVNKVNKSILKFVLRIPAEEYQAYKDLNPALTDFITHKLNETELSVLKPFIYKLKQQPIFETSKLVSIANEMPNMDSTEFKEWKFELLNAIYKMDKETFKKLLNE